MLHHARCGLVLSALLTTLAFKEGDDEIVEPTMGVSFLQVNAVSKSVSGTVALPRIPATLAQSNAEVMLFSGLHTPYHHIAVNVTYNNFMEEVLTFPQRCPREFNVMLATVKTWTADLVVQFAERRRVSSSTTWKFDWNRSVAFALFGFIYIGIAQWVLYVTVLTWLFPDAMVFANAPLAMKLKDQTGMIDMAGQIAVDVFIFAVFIYFPVFYVIKTAMQGSINGISSIQSGLAKYRANCFTDILTSCAVWIPADVVIFACPMYLRMPMEHAVSFGWTMFISAMRGAAEQKEEPKSETKVWKSLPAEQKEEPKSETKA